MRVMIPTHLHRYTDGVSEVEATGATLGEVLTSLDETFPGLRFRVVNEQDEIRPHVRLVVNESIARDLKSPVGPGDTVHIIAALSGG